MIFAIRLLRAVIIDQDYPAVRAGVGVFRVVQQNLNAAFHGVARRAQRGLSFKFLG